MFEFQHRYAVVIGVVIIGSGILSTSSRRGARRLLRLGRMLKQAKGCRPPLFCGLSKLSRHGACVSRTLDRSPQALITREISR